MTEKQEPSILDYLKSKLCGDTPIEIPEIMPEPITEEVANPETLSPSEITPSPAISNNMPWLFVLSLITAMTAQVALEFRIGQWMPGVALYVLSAVLLVLHFRQAQPPAIMDAQTLPATRNVLNPIMALISLFFAVISFILFKNGSFNLLNILTWAASVAFMLAALNLLLPVWTGFQNLTRKISRQGFTINIQPIAVLGILGFLLAVFFRAFLLNQIPGEMVSDHAEKLLDVYDVLQGKWSVFFLRNTGREALQFYLTAWIAKIFNTGISFLSLKLGTLFLGLLTLPFMYLIGKELGGARLGVFALILCGIAYWPNLITRFALRFTLYPAFFAPALYFFIRAVRTNRWGYYALSGIFLGIGLHGYTPFRVAPLVILIGSLLAILHTRDRAERRNLLYGLLIIIVISALVALPLLRYGIDHPDQVWYRTLTRVSNAETSIQGSPFLIFLQNLWHALTMFFWDNGEVWVISIPHRPALDIVTAALYFLGLCILIYRYFRSKNWLDLLLLISIPILMLPSIMSIAFPAENPSLNRPAGAIIPVFILAALGLEFVYRQLYGIHPDHKQTVAVVAVSLLLLLSIRQNYDLVFHQYRTEYDKNSLNSSELGAVAKSFIDGAGSSDSVFLVGYPYWVDSRLVAIQAGVPAQDFGIMSSQLNLTVESPSPKLFLLNLQDQASISTLTEMYPSGKLSLQKTHYAGKDFFTFVVP